MCFNISGSWHVPACPCDREPAGPGEPVRCKRFQRWAAAARLQDVIQPGRYEALLEAAKNGSPHFSVEKERQLELDVGRTWPSLCIFADGCGRESLSNLLKAWIIYDGETAQEHRQQEASASSDGKASGRSEAVGYVQGHEFYCHGPSCGMPELKKQHFGFLWLWCRIMIYAACLKLQICMG